jgi:hypothetical protein
MRRRDGRQTPLSLLQNRAHTNNQKFTVKPTKLHGNMDIKQPIRGYIIPLVSGAASRCYNEPLSS